MTKISLHICSLLILSQLAFAKGIYAQTASGPEVIVAQENAFWKSYEDANTAELSKLLSADFINVEEQIMNKEQVLSFVRQFHEQCTLSPVKVLDPKVSFINPGVATLVYHATETPTCGSHTMSGDTNISTVWVRRDGRWLMHLHTEYSIPAK